MRTFKGGDLWGCREAQQGGPRTLAPCARRAAAAAPSRAAPSCRCPLAHAGSPSGSQYAAFRTATEGPLARVLPSTAWRVQLAALQVARVSTRSLLQNNTRVVGLYRFSAPSGTNSSVLLQQVNAVMSRVSAESVSFFGSSFSSQFGVASATGSVETPNVPRWFGPPGTVSRGARAGGVGLVHALVLLVAGALGMLW